MESVSGHGPWKAIGCAAEQTLGIQHAYAWTRKGPQFLVEL